MPLALLDLAPLLLGQGGQLHSRQVIGWNVLLAMLHVLLHLGHDALLVEVVPALEDDERFE